MNVSLSKELIEEVAAEMGVNPSFVEKDWYAVQILKAIAPVKFPAPVIFTGGTSLSKGFSLIKRFSEDLDFKVSGGRQLTRGQRRKVSDAFLEAVTQIEGLCILSTYPHDEHRKVEITVGYPKMFDTPLALRQNLKIELFYDNHTEGMLSRDISSFIDQYLGNDEKISVVCNNPFYIIADKFNAITWRIYAGQQDFDYTNMRHLHDIYVMRSCIEHMEDFKARVLENFITKDKHRVAEDLSFETTLLKTTELLKTDKKYKEGYERFVSSMSYADDVDIATFDKALSYYEELSKLFI